MMDSLSGNALRIQCSGVKAENVAFMQSVPAKGSEGDVFVIGGWCKHNSVASGSDESAPALRYRLCSGSTHHSWHRLEFNMRKVGWQFGCWPIVADNSFRYIEIEPVYDKNKSTAYFSNLFFPRRGFPYPSKER